MAGLDHVFVEEKPCYSHRGFINDCEAAKNIDDVIFLILKETAFLGESRPLVRPHWEGRVDNGLQK